MPLHAPVAPHAGRWSRRPLLIGGGMLIATIGGVTIFGAKAPVNYATRPDVSSLQLRAFAAAETRSGYGPARQLALRVGPGKSLQRAVERTGIDPTEAKAAVAQLSTVMDTRSIQAGLPLEAAVAEPRTRSGPVHLISLSLRSGPATALTLSRTFDGALNLRSLEERVTDEVTVARGEMQGSLYESASKAGATGAITAQVVKLFSHKLDFSRDIRPGDHFSLIFERKVTESGRTVDASDLQFAEIEAKGGETRFYRFDRRGAVEPEFFDEFGKNIRGFLLRTPIDGARITSVFGLRRHPILGYTRAHQGVDFAAGAGTPILAAGDGIVAEAKYLSGYGNWVRIRHAGDWDTGYGHISRFAPGIRAGTQVHQGQVIAYVGSTGLATGPHLHYEIWNRGQRINPVGAKVPQGTILLGAELAAFRSKKAQIDRMLAQRSGPQDHPRMAQAAAEPTGFGLRPSFSAGGR